MKEGLTMEKITIENWPENWSNVPAWTEVSEEVYEHFLNCLPPLVWRGNYFQCSEPYTHEPDKNSHWRGKYLTFTRKDGKCWYLGIQFRNEYPKNEGRAS